MTGLRECECGWAFNAISEDYDGRRFRVACGAPHCMASTAWHRTRTEAIAAWNRRAPDDIADRARDFVKFVLANGPHVDDAASLFMHLEWDELRAAFPDLQGETPNRRAPTVTDDGQHLTGTEQRAMHSALRASVRLVPAPVVTREEVARVLCVEAGHDPDDGNNHGSNVTAFYRAADAIIALIEGRRTP